MEYIFIAIAPRFIQARSGSTWQSPTYVSNWSFWYLNWVQTNDFYWIELLEIELFYHLTLCKHMTDVNDT